MRIAGPLARVIFDHVGVVEKEPFLVEWCSDDLQAALVGERDQLVGVVAVVVGQSGRLRRFADLGDELRKAGRCRERERSGGSVFDVEGVRDAARVPDELARARDEFAVSAAKADPAFEDIERLVFGGWV